MRREDVIGKKFGMLTITAIHRNSAAGRWRAVSDCDCGVMNTDSDYYSVIRGETKSCGCGKGAAGKKKRLNKFPIGETFGMLTLISVTYVPTIMKSGKIRNNPVADVLCECGNTHTVHWQHLRRGSVRSCGCNQAPITHGHTVGGVNSPTFGRWSSMHTRVKSDDPSSKPHYKDKGITVCERWTGVFGFANFFADMGEVPLGLSLDRVDPDGNYEPDNCRWATKNIQSANTKRRAGNKTGYKNVYRYGKSGFKWTFTHGGERAISEKKFTTADEAAGAYDKMASVIGLPPAYKIKEVLQ